MSVERSRFDVPTPMSPGLHLLVWNSTSSDQRHPPGVLRVEQTRTLPFRQPIREAFVTLVFFDIDGTLVRVNTAGRETLGRALSQWANRPVSTDGVSFSGRTDPAIVRAILKQNDLSPTSEMISDALAAYVEAMTGTLGARNVDVLPGVPPLLDALHERTDVQLALLTGNVEPVAYEKLRAHGLDKYFSLGAFGSDHADRDELAAIARRRAATQTNHARPRDRHITVVGDTIHDISCARAIDARAVAVCTGRYTRTELEAHEPDVLLDSLDQTEHIVHNLLPA